MTPTAKKLNARAETAREDGDDARAEGFARDARIVRRIEDNAIRNIRATLRRVDFARVDPGAALEAIGRIAAEAITEIRNG